jgi:diguanylate cyclase (GGDEF)-like protein/PAS domain S-box-containing protein
MTQDDGKPRSSDRHDEPDDIAAQAAMFRLMVENSVDVIIRYDASLNRVYISPSSLEILGYAPEEMMGGYASKLIHPDDFAQTDTAFRMFGPAQPNFNLTFRAIRKDGRVIWVEARYRYLPGDGGALAVMRDVTERRHVETVLAEANETLEAANRILRTLAQQDGLTGLANRRRFDEVLEQEFRRARRQGRWLSVLLLDADRFKAYNDHYGHLAGDECLRRISRGIEGALRRPSDHAARFGGEEFVVLLPDTDADGALLVAEQIRAATSALGIEHLGSAHGTVTVSIGISSLTPFSSDENPDQLIAAADQALYRAKAQGRNRVASQEVDGQAVDGQAVDGQRVDGQRVDGQRVDVLTEAR